MALIPREKYTSKHCFNVSNWSYVWCHCQQYITHLGFEVLQLLYLELITATL